MRELLLASELVVLVLGWVSYVLLLIFLALALIYTVLRRVFPAPAARVDLEEMPVLRPIPIPTRNRLFPMRILVWLFHVRRWRLEKVWRLRLAGYPEIVLPEGFEFDGASIPRPLWQILSPTGLLLLPGLIHDYGYRHRQLWTVVDGEVVPLKKGLGKAYWDFLFLRVGTHVNGLAFIGVLAWAAVYLFGWLAWIHSRRIDETPVKPVLDPVSPP